MLEDQYWIGSNLKSLKTIKYQLTSKGKSVENDACGFFAYRKSFSVAGFFGQGILS